MTSKIDMDQLMIAKEEDYVYKYGGTIANTPTIQNEDDMESESIIL